jgi:hypothetical protein
MRLVLLILAAVGIWYIASPYENCKRNVPAHQQIVCERMDIVKNYDSF